MERDKNHKKSREAATRRTEAHWCLGSFKSDWIMWANTKMSHVNTEPRSRLSVWYAHNLTQRLSPSHTLAWVLIKSIVHKIRSHQGYLYWILIQVWKDGTENKSTPFWESWQPVEVDLCESALFDMRHSSFGSTNTDQHSHNDMKQLTKLTLSAQSSYPPVYATNATHIQRYNKDTHNFGLHTKHASHDNVARMLQELINIHLF